MHGRNVSLMGRVQPLSSVTGAGVPGAASAQSLPIAGFRNLFKPSPAQKFSAGGLVDLARTRDDKPLRQLMRKLSDRMARREDWSDTLPSADADLHPSENPGIPAGYTYLLQLMAHDMIDSAVSLAEAGAGRTGFVNTRVEPLCLDTIYGGGPDNAPHVYEFDAMFRQNMGTVPRTRLRLGRIAKDDGTVDKNCPFRDLARALPIDTTDDGLKPGERLDQPLGQQRPWRTEVLAADVRNDSHALISQLTVLLHILHNHVLGLLGPPSSDALSMYRRFVCARIVVTMIYRSILVKDVMARILHPAVYKRYVTDKQPLLETGSADADDLGSMPLEFSHGAFRFGHAMVRDFYRVNKPEKLAFGDALTQSSVHRPNNLPVRDIWHVDWSEFFETDTSAPNWSLRIGPNASGPLLNLSAFPALIRDLDADGVQSRDLVSASFADLWSAPALAAELRSLPGLAAIVPDYEVWKAPLRAWLGKQAGDFEATEIEVLVNDPPLPFFVMFEAGHTLVNGAPVRTGGGRHLGPFGSLIVSETIFGALQRNPIGYETPEASLKDRIATVCAALLPNDPALAAIPEIGSMPELLTFLRDGGAINLPGKA
jgi:hypothetical protein